MVIARDFNSQDQSLRGQDCFFAMLCDIGVVMTRDYLQNLLLWLYSIKLIVPLPLSVVSVSTLFLALT